MHASSAWWSRFTSGNLGPISEGADLNLKGHPCLPVYWDEGLGCLRIYQWLPHYRMRGRTLPHSTYPASCISTRYPSRLLPEINTGWDALLLTWGRPVGTCSTLYPMSAKSGMQRFRWANIPSHCWDWLPPAYSRRLHMLFAVTVLRDCTSWGFCLLKARVIA